MRGSVGNAMARLPVRLRVTLAFAGVMAILLGAGGLVLYLGLRAELDATIDQGLRSRTAELLPAARRGDPIPGGNEEGFARVLRPGAALPDFGEPLRVLRTRLDAGRVLAVGQAIDDRNDALRTLALLLLVGGPVMLLLASAAGYGAAAAALRPVERMRRRADATTEPSARLPVPPADDEIGRLGTTLNAMLARLEVAYARERAFVADASHELRTPLAILKAELELALREGRTPEELEAALRSAAEETDRLVALAEDLLVIARLEEGRLPVRPVPLDAGAVLRRFGPAEAPAGLVLRADRERVDQALRNLVDNARRHGGGHVELAAERVNGNVELHVRDDGPGFPPEFLDAAFERFTRGDPARSRGGAGLGLAIVDVIARAHGGAAGAANRAGGGADVWISLPCAS
jgi:two-component system OmpR family sensor kinase